MINNVTTTETVSAEDESNKASHLSQIYKIREAIRTPIVANKKEYYSEAEKYRSNFLEFIRLVWDNLPFVINTIDVRKIQEQSDTTYDEVICLFVIALMNYFGFHHCIPSPCESIDPYQIFTKMRKYC